MYHNPIRGVGTKVNKAFDAAVKTIRTAMLADQQKIESAAHGASAPPTPRADSASP
jgi:hypothetical protein